PQVSHFRQTASDTSTAMCQDGSTQFLLVQPRSNIAAAGAVAAFFVCRRVGAADTVGLVSFGYFLWWSGGASHEGPKSKPVLPRVGVSSGTGVCISLRQSRRGG